MIHTPCENIVWKGLPIIRREITEVLTDKYGLSQKETAEKLGISYAAVSQYKSGKRGKIIVKNKYILNQIDISAKRIIKNGKDIVVTEICRLCKIFISKKVFTFKT
jgi:predicted transcriptional regulator